MWEVLSDKAAYNNLKTVLLDVGGDLASSTTLDIDAARERLLSNSATDASREVVTTLGKNLRSPERETRFFLCNISNYPNVFTIVGLWWPKRRGDCLFDEPTSA